MAWTDSETARVNAIESMLNKIQTVITKLASQAQLRSLSALRQTELNDLKADVETLKTQVSILQKNSI